MTKGKLIVLDGVDGSGKTTQIAKLENLLKANGHEVVRVREPGGTPVGERIRAILLEDDMTSVTELMLFMASRIELIHKVILPALQEGKLVLCDRFMDSTFAYQGAGRGLVREFELVSTLVTDIIRPDHVLFLELPVTESIDRLERRRKANGASDRLDQLDLDMKTKIFAGFQVALMRAKEEGLKSHVVIDALGSEEEVEQRITDWAISEGFVKS